MANSAGAMALRRRNIVGLGHLGHRRRNVPRPGFGDLERHGAVENLLAMLDRNHASSGKAPAVARALHVVDDRRRDVAGAQKIRMQRMRSTPGFDRLLRGGQGLTEHLAAEHVTCADIAALAAEQIVFETFELEQIDQLADDGVGHQFSDIFAIIRDREDQKAAIPGGTFCERFALQENYFTTRRASPAAGTTSFHGNSGPGSCRRGNMMLGSSLAGSRRRSRSSCPAM